MSYNVCGLKWWSWRSGMATVHVNKGFPCRPHVVAMIGVKHQATPSPQELRNARLLTSASLIISADKLKLGARTAYFSTSTTTSLMMWSIASRLGTSVSRMLDSEGDMEAPMISRVCETTDKAPCQR